MYLYPTAAYVEVLVSGGLVSEGAATPCGATYTSVGKVTLAKPALQARTRELRSVVRVTYKWNKDQ